VGAQWSGISAVALRLSVVDIAVLFVVWLAGLAVYGAVQAAALPGLGVQRALMLNFAGSCVSSIVPFGGVAGTGVNLAMVRRWNHSTQSFVQFVAVTHILNLAAKLALPAIAIAALLGTGAVPTALMLLAGTAALAGLVVVLMIAALVLLTDAGASIVARALAPGLRLVGRVWPALAAHDLHQSLDDLRRSAAVLLRSSWARLAAGMTAYSVLQFVLFLLCLRMVGSAAPLAVLFAGFAVERVMTLVVITPGGVGLAETATAFALVALHADPVVSAAGVVIYRMFTYLFEIPVGAAWLAAWTALRMRSNRRQRIAPA
jgi:uncharacterized membrane protein YbhN (UPF0104 family)